MRVAALLYLDDSISDNDLFFQDFFVPEALARRLSALDRVDGVYYSVPASYSGKIIGLDGALVRSGADDVNFWKQLFAATGADHIVRVYADAPFLDPAIVAEMLDVHLQYLAEFTYSENLPEGLTADIVSRELMDSLPETAEKTLPLSKVVKSNINHFIVEIFYKDPDLRDKRINFRTSNRRDRRIMERIAADGGIPIYTEIRDRIEKNPESLYAGPGYLEIELVGRCDLDCIFCYRKKLSREHGDMDPALFRKILADMRTFDLPYVICVGGSGEPLMHPNFYEMLDAALAEPLVSRIIIETNGLYADDNFTSQVRIHESRITVIVNCNGHTVDAYAGIHGSDCFNRVSAHILALRTALAAEQSLYVQVMKIHETNGFLDQYYDFWEKHKVPIILQKQDTYLGLVDDRRYSDLSPIERTPCWHLQRDLYVLADGTVAFCKQDIDGQVGGKLIGESAIREIWDDRKRYFVDDYRKHFAENPRCASCDEWYTFNF